MAGGDAPRAQHLRMVEKCLELDFTVAHNVGVRCTTTAVLAQEMLEYVVPVLARKIDRVQAYAESLADLLRVGEVDARRTVFPGIVFLPIFHEQAFDLVSLL